MNPKAICADVGFRHPHDTQAFYRMHNVKRTLTGPHTPWPNGAEMFVRLFKKFLLALVDTASKNLDQTSLAQITPAHLMRKTATVRNTQITLSGKMLVELAMGRRPRDLLDPASMNPEQLTSTPTKKDLLNEEIQKLVMRTHLEAQQREDIRRDLAEPWSALHDAPSLPALLFLAVSQWFSPETHPCPLDAQDGDSEKYPDDLKWQDACGVVHGTKTKRSLGPSFNESRTADIHTNQEGSSQ